MRHLSEDKTQGPVGEPGNRQALFVETCSEQERMMGALLKRYKHFLLGQIDGGGRVDEIPEEVV